MRIRNMKNLLKFRKMAVGLFFAALLPGVRTASAALTITTTNQVGTANTYPFTPTWTPSTGSLIAGLAPTTTAGNFNLDLSTRNVNSLTAGGSLAISTLPGDAGPDPIGNTTTSGNYVTCGNRTGAPAAGSLLVYTLPASANGYNLTNITVYSGWADSGRDAQAYTVLYSTVANPGNFIFLANVSYNPSVPGSTPSANRVTVSDSLGGVIAANVAAVKFVFSTPQVENGWTGYGAITVEGTPAASVVSPVVSITASNQSGVNPFTPTWIPETPSMIAGMAPSTATGDFAAETSGGTNVLTDGIMGVSGDVSYFATAGNGRTLIYTLTNVVNGSDVTNVILYSGWGNADRDGQYFTLSYSTVAAPTTYIPITTVFYNPIVASGASANRLAINMTDGSALASAVANLKFDFSPTSAGQFDNGYQGYSEIIVQGGDTAAPPPPPSPFLTQDTLPTHVETFVGDQVVFTADYSNAPPATLQWQYVNAGGTVTNDIPGATSSTLTLNNAQLADAGTYRLKAVNATNGLAAPSYSRAVPLAVSAPITAGNIVVKNTGQTGPSGFYPAWSINTNLDLIFGYPTDQSGNPSSATAGPGNYGVESGLNSDPTILVDGNLSGLKADMVSCGWVNVGAGQSMTYTLPTTANGYNITNITIYGGWPDDGRNEQKYQVLYSTVAAPSTFTSIGTFDYNPSFTSGEPNVTRVTLEPITGALAQNVYAVQINFNLQSKNNWNGYSEITINGNLSAGVIPTLTQDITPLTAEDVVGSQLILTGDFSGATSYQWQKNGTNIPGATTTTLTLNNLQLTDTATNGGYRLLGINSAGTNATRGCAVVVNPAPVPVGNVITTFAYQTSDAGAPNTFGPTWDTSALSSSLIAGQFFPDGGFGTGNFNDPDVNFPNSAGGLPILTDGSYGLFAYDGSHPAFATAGSSAGEYVIYTLGAAANGYNVTNIQIAGGWNDNGRDSQYYTILYSTVANPTLFIPLTSVAKNLSGYGINDSTTVRTTFTPAAGVLASNVYAIEVDFQYPSGVPNGYSGYSEISVFGSPSASVPPTGPVITTEHEELDNIWTVETPNLIANQLPGSFGSGSFTQEGCNVTNLTDGQIGFGFAYGASCGAGGGAVPWIVFNAASGWDLTNIVVYTLWNDYGRDGQFYDVSYSTLSAPNTFLPLASVAYNPFVPHNGTATGNRVTIAPALNQTTLATNVAAVKFDFTSQGTQDFGWSGYSEIVLQGANLTASIPPLLGAPTVSGGNIIFTGTGGTPNSAYSLVTAVSLTTPLAQWTPVATGTLDGSGAFSNSVPVDPAMPTSFFRVRIP